ncbi:hypothetical protein PN466_19305 [Roseofilum reptotaenium CS-1145]|uniref:Uncharacterized protein n=1 Tax=Roseofilum reptotaenium AO1-A TaxID=1925591 RepID=A0A1L9QT34_9CYAN|nr:hypothetical protein [Roseofilum reptotaenium]MDB9519096.1 hypothetical protein [Roseofilum reptotaenium CS-1145]OJJ25850.1 hypothetical protein BI308_08925 [Roseofilum reptotaenium AO1-A]
MNPEEIIQAFLNVWETNPNDIFTTSGAIAGLEELNDMAIASATDSNTVFVDKLGKWCAQYPKLTDEIFAEAENQRKFKLKNNIPEPETAPKKPDKTLDNLYPKIPRSLRDRLPKS